jgi:hypothetical protein
VSGRSEDFGGRAPGEPLPLAAGLGCVLSTRVAELSASAREALLAVALSVALEPDDDPDNPS